MIVPVNGLSNRVYRGDALLVCSDGLYNTLDDAELAALLAGGTAQEACRRLVDEANQRGTLDNLSAAVLRVLEGPDGRCVRRAGRRAGTALRSAPLNPARRLIMPRWQSPRSC